VRKILSCLSQPAQASIKGDDDDLIYTERHRRGCCGNLYRVKGMKGKRAEEMGTAQLVGPRRSNRIQKRSRQPNYGSDDPIYRYSKRRGVSTEQCEK
jgi:hypothetical protein